MMPNPNSVTDFNRSFIVNTTAIDGRPVNTCRTQVLARCTLVDNTTGQTTDYFLGKACIGEHMYPEGGIAQVPTSEVSIIFSRDVYKLQKRFADHRNDINVIARPDEEVVLFDGRTAVWTDLRFAIHTLKANRFDNVPDIIQGIQQLAPLTARTVIEDIKHNMHAVLEYPIPYINFKPDGTKIQVDTGPILYAGATDNVASGIESIEPAYIMYQDLGFAEFAVCAPTVIGDAKEKTRHFSKIVQTQVGTTIYGPA